MEQTLTEQVLDCSGGCNSAFDDSSIYLQPNEVEWAHNVTFNKGRARTRPPLREIANYALDAGQYYQGGTCFSVGGGMLVLMIGGRCYRINPRNTGHLSADLEDLEVTLPFLNNPTGKRVWFAEVANQLIIQDGESRAIIYDGGRARRSDRSEYEVPIGRAMAYDGARLWVLVGRNKVAAGDITDGPTNPLVFTEINSLVGGGTFTMPGKTITLAFLPRIDSTTGYGGLVVYGDRFTRSLRADLVSRDQWQNTPGFNTSVFDDIGSVGDAVAVEQDLYWRSQDGHMRSLRAAVTDAQSPGYAPISMEIGRLFDHDSPEQLRNYKAVYFDNRLIMLTSPFFGQTNRVHYKHLAVLAFANLSRRGSKSPPAYDGQWHGMEFIDLIKGNVGGRERAFAIGYDATKGLRIFEIEREGMADHSLSAGAVSIKSRVELRKMAWGQPALPKILRRARVHVSDIKGSVTLKVYARTDSHPNWVEWDSVTFCATQDAATPTDLSAQHRTGIKTFTPQHGVDELTKRSQWYCYTAQLAIEWTGHCRIDRVTAEVKPVNESDYADRDALEEDCQSEIITTEPFTYEVT